MSTATTPHPIQVALIGAIHLFTHTHPYGPSVRDLSVEINRSLNATMRHLEALRAAGVVTWTPRVARSIRLVEYPRK